VRLLLFVNGLDVPVKALPDPELTAAVLALEHDALVVLAHVALEVVIAVKRSVAQVAADPLDRRQAQVVNADVLLERRLVSRGELAL
jgi:hypothetical protein